MSAPRSDVRAEAARLLREVRGFLEREQAEGGGDLWAWSLAEAGPQIKKAPAAPPSRPEPAAPRAAVGPSAVPQAAPAMSGSLFSEESLPEAKPSFAFAAPAPVAALTALHPAGEGARTSLWEASIPVLDAIATEVRACTRCGLCETRTQAVPGTGSARAGIVFVGEAPGADEDRRGEPFVGRAGELLTRIIEAMNRERLIPGVAITRETVYICNVLKCRPPENRNPLPHEIETCSPYLRRQLEALKPRIICCLGKFAAELLLGVKGTIGGLRGRIYRYQGSKLIVTYHPAACLRNPAYKRPVWEDMQLLAREYVSD